MQSIYRLLQCIVKGKISPVFNNLRNSGSSLDLLWLAQRLQINSQLLALLVQMTPFQAQCPRHICHVKVVPPNLRQQHFPLERFGPVRKRPRRFRPPYPPPPNSPTPRPTPAPSTHSHVLPP